MLQLPLWTRRIGLALALSALSACGSSVLAPEDPDLAALRAYTSPLRDLDSAMAAGFDVKLTECRDNPPIGGMGYHYAYVDRIDGAHPTVLEPEILVFAPGAGDDLELAAVEYIVPYAAWDGDPPTLFDQTFIGNDGDEVWQLHVWLWRDNPAGLFEDWNPDVSCD